MQLFETRGKITPLQDKTNIVHHFSVPDGVNKIAVKYSYSPKTVDDKDLAVRALQKGMKKYGVTFFDPERFMPVNNLITLSFDERGEYRGACHRQANKQTIVIAGKNSTPGILNREIQPGDWDVMLNVHFVGCDVDYNIEITGEVD